MTYARNTERSLHQMYRNLQKKQQTELAFIDFEMPFGKKLNADNRWVKLGKLIPWQEFEEPYQSRFGTTGNTAIPFRVALGSLLIKEHFGYSDDATVEQIQENPYLQFFIGYPEYKTEKPFDSSMMVHFRKRIGKDLLVSINERICREKKKESVDTNKDNDTDSTDKNTPKSGKLIIDATCAPEDMRHPNDVLLLNESRELTERVIDRLWDATKQGHKKPRTYRKKARKAFLSFIRKKKRTHSELRTGIRKQLQYVRRNLTSIEQMKAYAPLSVLDKCDYKKLLVVAEVYRQQKDLFAQLGNPHRSIADRIVSVCKPHVRPIVRGKAAVNTEFGAKISVSVIAGKVFLDKLSWDAYNESGDLKNQAEAYKARTGWYPESIHADMIYRTQENRRYCKGLGIRLSGVALGRPPARDADRKERLRVQRADEIDRIEIEGKFGVAKRRYSLDRIMTKLRETSEHAIALVFLAMNLDKILRDLLLRLLGKTWYQWFLQYQEVLLAA
jgi:transposase, IS5 family